MYKLARDYSETSVVVPEELRYSAVVSSMYAITREIERVDTEEEALVLLADLKELLDVFDCLVGRKLSRKQLELRETLGGYDKFNVVEE